MEIQELEPGVRNPGRLVRSAIAALTVLGGALLALPITAQDQADPRTAAPNGSEDPWPAQWPRGFKTEAHEFTIYQPQIDNWNGAVLGGRAAVNVRDADGKNPTYGVVWFTANTQVDRMERVVTLDDVAATRVKFPANRTDADDLQNELQQHAAGVIDKIALDELTEQLKLMHAVQSAAAIEVENEPPRLIFSEAPAMLVHLGGEPVWRPVPDTGFQRVLNTTALLVKDADGSLYLHVFDGWMTADTLDGPWSVAAEPPAGLASVLAHFAKDSHVDLLEESKPSADSKDPQAPSLASGTPPAIHVATTPTELIVFRGKPDYVPIPDTDLLFANNTTGDVFMNTETSQVFVLATGRWFTSSSLDGPWTYVPGTSLPPEFAAIPDDSPKENVKAAVPGTEQASEAVIANSIPQTAKVKLDSIKSEPPTYDGEPKVEPITGTNLSYVVNTATPVIHVPDGAWYCVEKGVWFTAPAPEGPWTVATEVPQVIYTIPTSSPLHYVTYVYVYGADDGYAYVGYTPGYYGTVVTNGVVVFGTGYAYHAVDRHVLLPAATDVRLRGEPDVHADRRLGDRLRRGLGVRQLELWLLLGPVSVLGSVPTAATTRQAPRGVRTAAPPSGVRADGAGPPATSTISGAPPAA